MKAVYLTDPHAYPNPVHPLREALRQAVQNNIRLLICGGDFLPLEGGICIDYQRRFLLGEFSEFLQECVQQQVQFIFMPGNEDLQCLDETAMAIAKRHLGVQFVHRRPAETGAGLTSPQFIGYSCVPDFWSPLKDRCRLDNTASVPVTAHSGDNVMSVLPDGGQTEFGFRHLSGSEWAQVAMALPTIQEDLLALAHDVSPEDWSRTVFLCHCPPSGMDLAVNGAGERFGSAAVRSFVLKVQPSLVLSGHFHNSPSVTGRLWGMLGNSMVIQPGIGMLAFLELPDRTVPGPNGYNPGRKSLPLGEPTFMALDDGKTS